MSTPVEREKPQKKGKNRLKEDREALQDLAKSRGDPLATAKAQLRTASKYAIGALVVVWLVCLSMWKGLDSTIPLWVALSFSIALGVAAFLIRRNLGKSAELGQLVSDSTGLTEAERKERIQKLADRVAKGEEAAIIAKAQLEMQDAPRDALATLEKVDLAKAQKLVAAQVRYMRALLHLNFGEVKEARALADQIDLAQVPDLMLRGSLASVISEAWARTGNPIEANQLLDKYPPDEKDFSDSRVQLLRARAFASAHGNDLNAMKRALKLLEEVSPQLLAPFVSQKPVHPLLVQEAKRRLEKSGYFRPRIQAIRR